MKKFFLLGAMALSALAGWAQTSPFAGHAVANGDEWYLYNVETGYWLGNNNHKWGDWTTRAQANEVGLDFKLEAIDGGWRIDPKYGRNNSMNSSNFYLDTNDGVTAWTFDEVECDGATKAYQIHAGDKYLGVVLGTNDKQDLGYQLDFDGNTHGTWVIVTREERMALATEENPVEASFLIPCYDMGDNNPRYNWHFSTNGAQGGPNVMWEHNRVWETWGVTEFDAYTTCTNIPNGKYLVYAIGAYVPTGGAEMNADDYNDYVARGSEAVHSLAYANDATAKMASIYSETYSSKGDNRWPKEIVPGVWVADGWGHVANQCGHYNKYWSEPVEVIVTNGNLRLGAKMDGEAPGSSWVILSGMRMKYCGEVQVDVTPYKEALEATIQEANAMLSGDYAALQIAVGEQFAAVLQAAVNTLNDADATAGDLESAKAALNDAMNLIKDMSPAVANIQQTYEICYSELEVKADAAFAAYLETVADKYYALQSKADAETLLRLMGNHRKLYAADKVDVKLFKGAEPAEGDFYLLNVGTGLFFNTEADWGTHIAVGNDGMLVHFMADGDNGQPIFKLNGNGFNGLNWSEEYWDKNGEHRFHFTPVEGKEKVYYFNVFDNHNWHFVYDVEDDVCDGGRRYWNAVQKRDRAVDDYKNDLCAQWMLVTKAEYEEYVKTATDAAPTTATMYVNNPNFNYVEPGLGNRTRGWENPGVVCGDEGGRHWSVLEWYCKDVDMKQIIEGLPAGRYTVSVNAFFRDGTSDNEAAKVGNGEELKQLATLYAATEADEVSSLLPNVTSEAGKLPGVGDTRTGVEGAFANWPWQSRYFFESGLYSVTTPEIVVGEDGKLTIGLTMTHDGTDGNWVVADNFRLTYLGEAAPFEVPTPTVAFSEEGDAFVFTFTGVDVPNADEPTMEINKVEFTANGLPYYGYGTGEIAIVDGAVDLVLPFSNTIQMDAETYMGSYENYEPASETINFVLTVTVYNNHADGSYETLADEVDLNVNGNFVVTGINAVEKTGNKVIYNISGQKLMDTKKGVNIINGKKTVVK